MVSGCEHEIYYDDGSIKFLFGKERGLFDLHNAIYSQAHVLRGSCIPPMH